MDYISSLLMGFSVLLQPINLLYCFMGCLIGTLVGVLPGIGPVGAMAILLPSTFKVPPVTGVIMLAGIYYGAMYGGSTTSILVNIPGEAASVVTCLDGYQMARQGRAGPALGIAAFGSFIGGTLSIIFLMFMVFPLANFSVKFGPPEYCALIFMGLILSTYLARGSMVKALISLIIGLILGCVGQDVLTGTYRFLMGIPQLVDGVPLVPMIMGVFGIAEVLENIETSVDISVFETKVRNLFPSFEDWKRSIGPILRGTFLGFGLGILPGAGTILASFLDYSIEKKISKYPEKFGTGMIEAVAGPETANNAACAGGLVPLMVFGIPLNIVMALLLGTLIVHGIYPGPLLIQKNPEIFWGLVASLYCGNVMLLVLNLPLIPIWVKALKIPYQIMFPLILLFCLIGAYSINNSIFDIYAMIFFGMVGYALKKYGYEFAPCTMALILGPMLEQAFRQSIAMSKGSFLIFLHRPISGVFVAITVVFILANGLTSFRSARKKIQE